MVVQVAPVEKNVSETLCSLNFAQRVRSVELGQATKKTESADIANMRDRLRELEVLPLTFPAYQVSVSLRTKQSQTRKGKRNRFLHISKFSPIKTRF